MSDRQIDAIRTYFMDVHRPQAPQVDSMHSISHARGKRAKRVIDMKRTSQDYYKTLEVQTPLLTHYENVDWYERDHKFDLQRHM